MKQKEKWFRTVIIISIFGVGGYIFYRGIGIMADSGWFKNSTVVAGVSKTVEEWSVNTFMPGLPYFTNQTSSDENWLSDLFAENFPLYGYVNLQEGYEQNIESKSEYEMILAAEAAAEENMNPRPVNESAKDTELAKASENSANPSEKNQEQDKGGSQNGPNQDTEDSQSGENQDNSDSQSDTNQDAQGTEQGEKDESVEASGGIAKRLPQVQIPRDKLIDYDYVLNNFYAIDMTTTIDRDHMNMDALLNKDMTMEKDSSAPQILIYHTHSQETFADSIPGDESTTILGIGDYLTTILQNKYGYNVIHHRNVYDLVDGELDRNKAYDLAFEGVSQVLADNPSVQIVIDLHRDGVDGKKFVTEIDGKPTAQIMFINGLSRTTQNGDITYLPNPYIEDNMAFAFQMKLKAMEYYPDFTRSNYLMAYRFNMHLRPKTLLVESGTQLSTVEEERNAMLPLADILNQVLSGE